MKLYFTEKIILLRNELLCIIRRLGLSNAPTDSLHTDKTSPNEFPGYDIKLSDGVIPVMLELWEMRSILSLPLVPGLIWPAVVSTSYGPI